jgi:small-conductance mechanosensitive channel/CRP-like cAMP-binding protein
MLETHLNEWLTVDTAVAGLIFISVAIVTGFVFRRERGAVRQAVVVFGLSLVLRLVTVLAGVGGLDGIRAAAGFLTLLFQGVAFVLISIVFIFALMSKAFHLDIPRLMRDLTKAFALIGLALYIFAVHDVDVSGIVATSAVITAVVGFSLQDVLTNIMGGLALNLDRSVQPGDWVEYGDVTGIVREISWRSTAIESREGNRYIVPNNQLMKNVVMLQGKRWDGSTKERRSVLFNVDFRHSPIDVINVVTEALNRQPIDGVAAEPAPDVIFFEFKDSWGHYAARYWLTSLLNHEWYDSMIRARVFVALSRARIPLSIPSGTLFMERDRGERVRLANLRRERNLRMLRHVPIFKGLNAEERGRLAEHLTFAPFAPGEAILVQGERGEDVYILTKGRVEVRVTGAGGATSTVAVLEAPEFFGEYGMLTGQERQASVVAVSEVETFRLGKDDFEDVLRDRPGIAEEVSDVLAEREVALRSVRESLSEQAKQKLIARERGSILERIEHFFGIS